MLAAVLAVIYAQTEVETGQAPQQTLVAPVSTSEVVQTPEAVSSEVAETQPRNKRAPILLGKALLGGALLGAGALGAGALGAGVLGAGVLGAGALGAGLYKAKL